MWLRWRNEEIEMLGQEAPGSGFPTTPREARKIEIAPLIRPSPSFNSTASELGIARQPEPGSAESTTRFVDAASRNESFLHLRRAWVHFDRFPA